MLEEIEHLAEGVSWATLVLGGVAAWYAYRHGIPWVWGKLQSMWGSTKAALQRLENLVATSVEDVHLRVDELATRVEALETKPAQVVHVVAPATPAPVAPAAPLPPGSIAAGQASAQASMQQQLLTPAGLPFPTSNTQGGAV